MSNGLKPFVCEFVESNLMRPRGMFGEKVSGPHKVDGRRLADLVEKKCNRLIRDGYKIIDVTPLSSGHAYSEESLGYSFTSGVMITASLDRSLEATALKQEGEVESTQTDTNTKPNEKSEIPEQDKKPIWEIIKDRKNEGE